MASVHGNNTEPVSCGWYFHRYKSQLVIKFM